MPVTRLVAPGPDVARHTPTLPVVALRSRQPHGKLLLMGCQDMGNLILVLVQCIIYIQDSAARITKYGVHALFLQTLNYNLCPVNLLIYCTPFLHVIS